MPKIIGEPKVRFNLFDWNAKEETYIIMYFQYKKGLRLKYSTGTKVLPKDWNDREQCAISSKRFSEGAEINARLDKLEKHCLAIYRENGKGKISPDDFRKELRYRMGDEEREAEPEHITFLEFAERMYEDRAKQPNAKKGSLQVVHKVVWHLQTYAKEKRRKLEFSELNEKFYNDFRDWLYSPPRSLSTNYVRKIFQNIKFFIRKAENKHLHDDRSYRDFEVDSAPVSKIALSFEQLEHMANLELSGHLEKARDLFLIGAYTGLRFGDFTRIRPEHIKDHKGESVIEITTQKTEQTVTIPLHPALDRVLKKYGYKSPKQGNANMNKYLKEIGRLAGFTAEIMVHNSSGGVLKEVKKQMWEELKTHVARRSFATNYYEKYPEQINSIMQITGHTTEKMFRAYIVTDKRDSAVKFGKAIKDR